LHAIHVIKDLSYFTSTDHGIVFCMQSQDYSNCFQSPVVTFSASSFWNVNLPLTVLLKLASH
jgi:hypothetical protein